MSGAFGDQLAGLEAPQPGDRIFAGAGDILVVARDRHARHLLALLRELAHDLALRVPDDHLAAEVGADDVGAVVREARDSSAAPAARVAGLADLAIPLAEDIARGDIPDTDLVVGAGSNQALA